MTNIYFNGLVKILVLVLFGLSQYCMSQAYVYEVKVIPATPRVQDTVEVGVWIAASGGGRMLSYGMAISGDTIDIFACISIGLHSAVRSYKDTLKVGQLPEGQYHLRVTALSSYTSSYCEPTDSNIHTQTFNISAYDVGTKELEMKEDLKIEVAPNPAKAQQIIHLQTATGETYDIRLYDPAGREVRKIFTGQLPSGKHKLTAELEGLPAGVYFYLVRTENGTKTLRMAKE